MLLLHEFFALRVREHKLEQLIPLLVRDQEHPQLSNNICDVLLHNGDRLLHESFEKQCLILGVFFFGHVAPQVGDDLAEVDTGYLTDVGFGVLRHEDEQVLDGFFFFEIELEEGGCCLDNLGVREEQLAQDLGEAV